MCLDCTASGEHWVSEPHVNDATRRDAMKTRKHLVTFVFFILRLMSAEFSWQIFFVRSSAPANENKYNSVEYMYTLY